MNLLARGGVYTAVMFTAFVVLDDRAVWKSLLGAILAGVTFTLLVWLWQRRAPAAGSSGWGRSRYEKSRPSE